MSVLTSKYPPFLTHFIEQMNMMVRMIMRATPVGFAHPPIMPNRPGLDVKSQSV